MYNCIRLFQTISSSQKECIKHYLIIPVAFTPFTYFKNLGFRSMYTDTVNFQNLNTDDNDKAIRYI